MKHLSLVAVCALLAVVSSSDMLAKGKQEQRQPEMCVVPAGAQPLLPAKLLPGTVVANVGVTVHVPLAAAEL